MHWIGPDAPGRVQFVAAADLREAAPAIARRAVARTPGEIDRWPGILDRALGLVDPDGEPRGARRPCATTTSTASPRASWPTASRASRTSPAFVEFDFLVAATDDAERALWRFLIEQDFVTGVRGRLRSVDEPLPWLLEDPGPSRCPTSSTTCGCASSTRSRRSAPAATGPRACSSSMSPIRWATRAGASGSSSTSAVVPRSSGSRARMPRPPARASASASRSSVRSTWAVCGRRCSAARRGSRSPVARVARARRSHVRRRAQPAPQHLVLTTAGGERSHRSRRHPSPGGAVRALPCVPRGTPRILLTEQSVSYGSVINCFVPRADNCVIMAVPPPRHDGGHPEGSTSFTEKGRAMKTPSLVSTAALVGVSALLLAGCSAGGGGGRDGMTPRRRHAPA